MKSKILKIIILVLCVFVYGELNIKVNAIDGVQDEEIKLSENEQRINDEYDFDLDTAIDNLSKQKVGKAVYGTLIISRPVPYYKQINNYFCGPATTLQIEKYFNKNSKSTQSSLAKELGTTKNGTSYSMIRTVLNRKSGIKNHKKGVYNFLNVSSYSKEKLALAINRANQRDNKPVVMNIAATNNDEIQAIGYKSYGHFLVASGVKGYFNLSSSIREGGEREVKLIDPFTEYGKKKAKGGLFVSTALFRSMTFKQPSSTKYILK